MATSENIPFFETSALNGTNVEEAFTELLRNILKREKGFSKNVAEGQEVEKQDNEKHAIRYYIS